MGTLCFLNDYPDLETALSEVLNCSKQLLKKYLTAKERKIKILSGRAYVVSLNLLNHLRINSEYAGPQLKIIYDSNDMLAVHKPHGIHSAPHSYLEIDNVLSGLRQQGILAPLLVNQSSYERGLLHRLDCETSGVLLLAKNDSYYQTVVQNRQNIFEKKYYLAIVRGKLADGLYHSRLDMHKNTKVKYDPAGLDVSLKLETLLYAQDYSLLLVELLQGHRHQIRFQLAQINSSIVGDELYGGEKADRLYLHSLAYAVRGADKKELIICSPEFLFYKFFDSDRALEVVANKVRSLKIF